jgi:hypothetical protein
MEPLIEIRTIPMSIELKVNNAKYELASSEASVEIRRENGGLQMKMQPTKLKIDTFEARNSTPFKSAVRSHTEFAKKGIQAANEATANLAREGNMMVNIHLNNNVLTDIAYQRFTREMMSKEFNLGFTPGVPIEIEFSEPSIDINYEMDKLYFDMRQSTKKVQFTPGSIELIIKEYARIELEYVGSPIYIPPSSDPNYKPVDANA